MLFPFLFICIACVVNAQVPAARTVVTGASGLLNNRVCYIVSAQYATLPNVSVRGNVFAAAMGLNVPNGGLYPWTALGYVKGSVSAETYNGRLSQVTVEAEANVAAWSYVAIGEFCDVNGVEGFQVGSLDYIIGYYTAPQAVLYNMNCGSEADPITGDTSYYGSIQTAGAAFFNTTCRVFPSNTTILRNGRIVGPYEFKCDIRIDYTTLWSSDNVAIRGCTPDKRKIGLLMNVAAASFDLDVTVSNNLNGAVANTPDGERIEFGAGRLRFSWDNYYKRTAAFAAITGTNGAVVAAHFARQTLNSNTTVFGVRVVEQIIFSFDQPKSVGSLFYWDPTTTVLDQSSSSALSACLSLVALCILSFFF